jgi:RNA polymerase sigma-70 factor (ECF subfamily)
MGVRIASEPAAGGVGPVRLNADFEAWLSPHLASLVAVAHSQVGYAHRDDLVQETVLRAWERFDVYDPQRGSARAWLIGILLNRARNYRLRHPWLTRLPTLEYISRDEQSAHAVSAGITMAVSTLPKRQREVVVLHYLCDLPVGEVGAVLGISSSAVKTHLNAARLALRTKLETDDDD